MGGWQKNDKEKRQTIFLLFLSLVLDLSSYQFSKTFFTPLILIAVVVLRFSPFLLGRRGKRNRSMSNNLTHRNSNVECFRDILIKHLHGGLIGNSLRKNVCTRFSPSSKILLRNQYHPYWRRLRCPPFYHSTREAESAKFRLEGTKEKLGE